MGTAAAIFALSKGMLIDVSGFNVSHQGECFYLRHVLPMDSTSASKQDTSVYRAVP